MAGKLSPSALDSLQQHALSLAQQAHDTAPMAVVRGTRVHLQDIETLLLGAAGWQRVRLHRTAALTALAATRASRLAGTRYTAALIDKADQHARDANDGPLLAQALFYRARHQGETGYAVDVGTRKGEELLVAALQAAGRHREQRLLRALIRYELAWEYAALGETRAALTELHCADIDGGSAMPRPDVVEVADGVGRGRRWAAPCRGAVLRRLARFDEAIAACTAALVGPPLWRTAAIVDIARAQAGSGSVDAAAASLRDAYVLNREAGLEQRQGRVRAVRATLPDAPAVRQLDDVLEG